MHEDLYVVRQLVETRPKGARWRKAPMPQRSQTLPQARCSETTYMRQTKSRTTYEVISSPPLIKPAPCKAAQTGVLYVFIIQTKIITCANYAFSVYCIACKTSEQQSTYTGHLRTQSHRNAALHPLREKVEMIQSAFKNRIATKFQQTITTWSQSNSWRAERESRGTIANHHDQFPSSECKHRVGGAVVPGFQAADWR